MSPFIYIIIVVWQNIWHCPRTQKGKALEGTNLLWWTLQCISRLHVLDVQAAQCETVHNARYMLKVCLQGEPLQHSPYSKSNWFTEFCKSLCLSQFTASFISVWAKASIAECIDKIEWDRTKKHMHFYVGQKGCCHTPASPHNPAEQTCPDHVFKITCKWSFHRFTYGNLVTTSPSSKW